MPGDVELLLIRNSRSTPRHRQGFQSFTFATTPLFSWNTPTKGFAPWEPEHDSIVNPLEQSTRTGALMHVSLGDPQVYPACEDGEISVDLL